MTTFREWLKFQDDMGITGPYFKPKNPNNPDDVMSALAASEMWRVMIQDEDILNSEIPVKPRWPEGVERTFLLPLDGYEL